MLAEAGADAQRVPAEADVEEAVAQEEALSGSRRQREGRVGEPRSGGQADRQAQREAVEAVRFDGEAEAVFPLADHHRRRQAAADELFALRVIHFPPVGRRGRLGERLIVPALRLGGEGTDAVSRLHRLRAEIARLAQALAELEAEREPAALDVEEIALARHDGIRQAGAAHAQHPRVREEAAVLPREAAAREAVGGERPACDGAQDHDLFLRLIDKMQCRDPAAKPLHIPQVLYYWRVHAASTSGGTAAKPYVEAAARKAVADHLAATGRQGRVEAGKFPGTCHVVWDIPDPQPLVSILIPNKDHTDDLEKCLHSLYAKTTYENFEVIVIENNSTDPATEAYYKQLPQRYDRARVVRYKGGFNFSRINNFGRKYATGSYLLLLNNDIEVINGDWLTQMVGECIQPGVGICGAMLYYPDDTIQHAGIITGLGGYAGHSHKYHKRGGSGYMFRLATVQDFSAVTAACLLVRTAVFDAVHGLDENLTVAYNDVDFCLRVRDAGWRILWTPYAELYHHESKSRGSDEKDPVKKARFDAEHDRLYEVHGRDNILHDPYYNPALSLDYEDFRESGDLRHLK